MDTELLVYEMQQLESFGFGNLVDLVYEKSVFTVSNKKILNKASRYDSIEDLQNDVRLYKEVLKNRLLLPLFRINGWNLKKKKLAVLKDYAVEYVMKLGRRPDRNVNGKQGKLGHLVSNYVSIGCPNYDPNFAYKIHKAMFNKG